MRLLITLFTLLLFNSCKVVKENDKYGIQFFIKSVYNDSDVVKSGSLLYEPFQVRKNNLHDIIIMQVLDSFYSPQNNSEIEQYLPKGLKSINMKEINEDLKKLSSEKIIIRDSGILSKKNEYNYLGYLKILQIFSNVEKTKVYIYYLVTDQEQKGYYRALAENHLINGIWKETKWEITDRN